PGVARRLETDVEPTVNRDLVP
ncbi:MAG: hypothetical protein QOE61_715, partial [Micromonosporaceae bacterium]|nr:hypothetical protein [Micromonosporaceae bacterium]